MAESDNDISRHAQEWTTILHKGVEHDNWGQPVEAMLYYKQLAEDINVQVARPGYLAVCRHEEKNILSDILAQLELRCMELEDPSSHYGTQTGSIVKLQQAFAELTLSSTGEYSPEGAGIPLMSSEIPTEELKSQGVEETVGDEGHLDEEGEFVDREQLRKLQGTLLPRIALRAGKTVLSIYVEKIGIKNASELIDPYLTVSVRDKLGVAMTPIQDTPVALSKDETFAYFHVTVEVQRCVEYLPAGFVIFFELKHFKPKKQRKSVKCFSFLESDEIKQGPVVIELYRKPTNYRRSNLKLLTTKPLYLNLNLSLHHSPAN
ncbi:PREDICTED: axin interactor, dorsalization-associated protein B-like isoform X2 [Priapulus caudatus]|uniref:Axin interactor, dorsalization-associated protein B-like isoform X2 n=1 Tax=Priapulus caudatus TaxID=37621 RepID=A0ABM1EBC8_PRICU|nr:PREDICTED: axin interactor, dorsalization-associated protein B-like isoform X2 [Priapulus caudatus]